MRRDREFLKTQREWYRKLKASGFNDIEITGETGRVHPLLRSPGRLSEARTLTFESTLSYYMLASQFLHEHAFPNDTTREVWRLHCEGVTYRVIAAQCRLSLTAVHRHIVVLRDAMMERNRRACIERETHDDETDDPFPLADAR
jgi:hypothetical protein